MNYWKVRMQDLKNHGDEASETKAKIALHCQYNKKLCASSDGHWEKAASTSAVSLERSSTWLTTIIYFTGGLTQQNSSHSVREDG